MPRIRVPSAAIIAAAFAIAVPMAASVPAVAQPGQGWRDVDGNNVTRVRHSGGGSFAERDRGRWTEFGADGRPINDFQESARDAFTVTLSNTATGTTVVIDLRAREIRSLRLLKTARFLYRITDAEARRRGRLNYDDHRWTGGPGRGYPGWDRGETRDIEVGPIWNQRDAETKCRDKARELDAEWTGQWRTTEAGRMSVCQLRKTGGRGGYGGGYDRDPVRDIEVGPIWNQRDAETKCRDKARELRGEWTGQWRTTVPGRMSVCEIRFR